MKIRKLMPFTLQQKIGKLCKLRDFLDIVQMILRAMTTKRLCDEDADGQFVTEKTGHRSLYFRSYKRTNDVI